MQTIIERIEKTEKLITLPEVYLQLKRLLEEPDYTMAEVALLVGKDPAMAVRFLRIVNSPLNRRSAKIETVSHAVSLLGSRQVHDIVLCASVAETFDGMPVDVINVKQFWQRSVYCAVTTQQLAAESGEIASERLFVTGLLHDIGHLLMFLAIPVEAQQAILTAKDLKRPLFQVERELFDFDYAKLGGDMLRQWELPKSLQMPIRFHLEPENAAPHCLEAALLHLSVLLVQSDLEEGDFNEGCYAVDPAAWSIAGLSEEQCLNTRTIAAQLFEEVANSFFS